MIKNIWNKIVTFLHNYYVEHKDDIIIAFIIATIIGILFKATCMTWFISLWFTIAFQILKCIVQGLLKKKVSGLQINFIIINFVIGVFISLLFLAWQ